MMLMRPRQTNSFCRTAFSILEVQVALLLLAVGFVGLFPLFVLQSRQIRSLESRLNPSQSWYLIPSTDEWARKLGCGASISLSPPGPTSSPPVLVIDNGDSGYSETGSGWKSESRSDAFRGSDRYISAGFGFKKAQFHFSQLRAGWYAVWLTWAPDSDRSSTVFITVYDNSTSRGTFTVNMQIPPLGDTYGGRPWELLGLVPIASSISIVEISNLANGKVIADGARLVEVRNTVSILSSTRSMTGETASTQVSIIRVTP